MKLEKKYIITLSIIFALILLLGSTYAYFSIQSSSDQSNAKVSGKAGMLGNPTLTTETSMLYLNLNANLMSQANAGKTYYANKDESGLALETNPNYVLATAQLPEGDEALDCTYTYKVSATIKNNITDGSDADVTVTIGNRTLTLKEILASTDGIIVTGELLGLTAGTKQSISLTSSVINTSNTQDNLVDNSYTIKIIPYKEGDTKAFSCKEPFKLSETKTLAQNLVDSGWLYQTNLEGDGYRYAGSGAVGTENNPNNFICFGTTDKSACTSNQDAYMYRIIGVFADENGNNHVKLIKYKQLGNYMWHTNIDSEVTWENSNVFGVLNGSSYLTNTTYFPDSTWLNKVANWTWSAVSTGGDVVGRMDYSSSTSKDTYLHEMNRNSKNNTYGTWTTPTARIGLMYASDYQLSLGIKSLNYSGRNNASDLLTGWLHQSNNDNSKKGYEWIISNSGYVDSYSSGAVTPVAMFAGIYESPTVITWYISSTGNIRYMFTNNEAAVRPVFYLTSNVKISTNGDGSLNNPYMIIE